MNRLPLVAAVLLLAGCTTDDPTRGGLFGGIAGLNSGAYAKRVDDRRAELENQQDQRVANQRAFDRAEQERTAVAGQRRESEAKLAALRGEVSSLRRQLAVGQRKTKAGSASITQLQEEVDRLERDVTLAESDGFATPEDKARRLEQLRRSKEELEREIQLAVGR